MAIETFVETERLILRELLPTDAAAMFELDSDPEVHRFLGNQPVKTIEESRDINNECDCQNKEHGINRPY